MPDDDRVRQRTSFLNRMVEVGVTPEFTADSKLRWEKAQFSSVCDYLTIGDISVKREMSCPLLNVPEVDMTGDDVDIGRISLTYDLWQNQTTITSIRLKLNGERFVYNDGVFYGFKTLRVVGNTDLRVLEYYAGSFYSIFPIRSVVTTMRVITWDNSEISIEILPHPYILYSDIVPSMMESHKYDGIMCVVGGKEYRAKWVPSTEIDICGTPFEVSFSNGRTYLMRARPGKFPYKEATARLLLSSEIPGRSLLPILSSSKLDVSKFIIRSRRDGCKILFLDEFLGFSMIREKTGPTYKKWDFIGGGTEPGETPIQTIIREVREEVQCEISANDLYFLGESIEQSDLFDWHSTVFIAQAPAQLRNRLDVTFVSSSFDEFRRNDQLRPRQPWVDRHLQFLMTIGTKDEMTFLLHMMHSKGKCIPGSLASPRMLDAGLAYFGIYFSRLWNERENIVRMSNTQIVVPPPNKFRRFMKSFFFPDDIRYEVLWDKLFNMSKDLYTSRRDLVVSKLLRTTLPESGYGTSFLTVANLAKDYNLDPAIAWGIIQWAIYLGLIPSSILSLYPGAPKVMESDDLFDDILCSMRTCSSCFKTKQKDQYSQAQWRKKVYIRCIECVLDG